MFRCRCLLLGVTLALVTTAGCEKKAGRSTNKSELAKGKTFAIPIPAGYKQLTDPKVTKAAPGGVVLAAKQRIAKGAFRGSIVVTRVPPGPDFDPKDAAVCGKTAAAMTQHAPVKLVRAGLVDVALGKTCQWEMAASDGASRGALGTVMYKTRSDCWVVTCNFDLKDGAARQACAAVLGGWRFNK